MHVYDALSSDVFEVLQDARVAYPPLPKRAEPVLTAQAAWEFHWVEAGRNSILFDPRDGLFKMWYRTANPDHPERQGWYATTFLRCYATSEDGVHWTRPNLGLFEHRHSTENNILDEYGGDGILHSVVLDLDDPDSARRYKSLGFCDVPDAAGTYTGFSADGLRWQRGNCVASTTRAADGASLVGRHPLTGKWMAIIRPRTLPKRRFIGVSFSDDFATWPDPQVALATDHHDPPDDQFDNLTAAWLDTYFVGIIGVFHTRPDEQTYDGQLAFSHDGVHWHRADRRPVLALSPSGRWDDSMVRPCSIIRRGDDLYIYYSGANRGQGTVDVQVPAIGSRAGGKVVAGSIGLIQMPVHRFAAIEPIGAGAGRATTRFISAHEATLRLNADASHGSIRVQMRDATGKPLPGLSFEDCIPVTGNSTDLEVKWKTVSPGDRVGDIARKGRYGSVIQLDFEMNASRLYAFRCG